MRRRNRRLDPGDVVKGLADSLVADPAITGGLAHCPPGSCNLVRFSEHHYHVVTGLESNNDSLIQFSSGRDSAHAHIVGQGQPFEVQFLSQESGNYVFGQRCWKRRRAVVSGIVTVADDHGVEPGVDFAEQLAVGEQILVKNLVPGAVYGWQDEVRIDCCGSKAREMLAGANDAAALESFEISARQSCDFGGQVAKVPSFQPVVDRVVECEIKDRGQVDIEPQGAQAFGGDLAQARSDGSIFGSSKQVG